MEGKSAVDTIAPAVAGSASSATSVAPDHTAVTAVLAHTLLNSLAIVRGGAELLSRYHDRLSSSERADWYRRIDRHSRHLADVLERMAQGRLADALHLCDSDVGAA